MLKILLRFLLALSTIVALGLGGLAFYNGKIGLGLRAKLGQPSGTFLHAVSLYQNEDISNAIVAIEPVVSSGYRPALTLLCGIINQYEPVAATVDDCVTSLEETPRQRRTSLTDAAIWAQEWDTAAWLLDRRIANGDPTAHFDRARLMLAGPPDALDAGQLMEAIALSNAAQDPRGQYAHVVSILNIPADGALKPILVELLTRQPKLTASDAYFELAKLIQTGAVSSDLGYLEVLLRADHLGNPDAARYLAQFFLSNVDQDPDGSERRRWLVKAAASGDPIAQFNLAVFILNNPSDNSHISEAIAYLDRSAAAGFIPAMNTLGTILLQNPTLLAMDEGEARKSALALIETAAEQDDPNALFNLGSIYVSQDEPERALPYLQDAAALGITQARDMLGQLGEVSD